MKSKAERYNYAVRNGKHGAKTRARGSNHSGSGKSESRANYKHGRRK